MLIKYFTEQAAHQSNEGQYNKLIATQNGPLHFFGNFAEDHDTRKKSVNLNLESQTIAN